RRLIRTAFLSGDIDRAIALTNLHFPSVLAAKDEAGGMLFKLKLRKFIEAVARAGNASPAPATESLPVAKTTKIKTRAMGEDVAMADNEEFSTSPMSPVSSTSPLDELLSLGQALDAEYRDDARPAVQSKLVEAFSLMAYESPQDAGGHLAWLLSNAA